MPTDNNPNLAITYFEKAMNHYTDAINAKPPKKTTAICYANRAAVGIRLVFIAMFVQKRGLPNLEEVVKYESALADAAHGVATAREFNPTMKKEDASTSEQQQLKQQQLDQLKQQGPHVSTDAEANIALMNSAIRDCNQSLDQSDLEDKVKAKRYCRLKLCEALKEFINYDFNTCFERLQEAGPHHHLLKDSAEWVPRPRSESVE